MSKPLILVVDDDVPVANSIANVIKDLGKYAVITANSAKEALGCLRKNKILLGLGGNNVRLIVLDIKMPEMDGLQFLEKVRRDYGENIGVTMLTAFEDEEKWDRATAGFVINYLRKPLDRAELVDTIEQFFAGKGDKLTVKTFEKHIKKREEFRQKGEKLL